MGGCIRDLLLGWEPKDFDVVTDAHPEQIKKVFRNCRLIGRRFRLAHVYFGREIIEVATFRSGSDALALNADRSYKNGKLLRDNVYGTLEEDVWRRDFTVNALYYSNKDSAIIDFVGGMEDHRLGLMNLIGNAETRYREDPVRMLRAVRFTAKLGFTLNLDCANAITKMASLLHDIPPARLNDEMLKLFLSGHALQTFKMLRQFKLFATLFPATEQGLVGVKQESIKLFITQALLNTDTRIAEGKTLAPYFLIAVFLWHPVQTLADKKIAQGVNEIIAYQEAGNEVISRQVKYTTFPKRIGFSIREVWSLQLLFATRTKKIKAQLLLEYPRFRAAYDFLLLRAETGNTDPKLAQWWTDFHLADANKQEKMIKSTHKFKRYRRSRNQPSGRIG